MAPTVDTVHVGTDVHALLRDLLEWKPAEAAGDSQVLTIYMNLDPALFATPAARRMELTSLLDEAERGASHHYWRAPIAELRAFFEARDFDIDDAHGIMAVATIDGALLRLVKLSRPVQSSVTYSEAPHIRPMIESLPRDTWCVLLANRRHARVLLGWRDEFHEVRRRSDPVHGQHEQGGWSQAGNQRHIEKQVDVHVQHTMEEVFALLQNHSFEHLAIAAPEALRPQLVDAMHPYLQPLMVGWLSLDVDNVSESDVRDAAGELIEQFEQQRQRELLERLRANAGMGARAALGLQLVLEALNEQRVGCLLIAEGFAAPGALCPACGWKSAIEGSCPVDGTAMQRVHDIVELAIEAAVLQSASVVNVGRFGAGVLSSYGVGSPANGNASENGRVAHDRPDRTEFLQLQGFGSIAALARFDLAESADRPSESGE